MRRGAPSLVGLSMLAACGTEPARDAEEPSPAANESAGPVASPDGASDAPAPDPSGLPREAPIPAGFRGVWAETEALCGDLAHPSRLVISGIALRFHEAVATIDRVERLGPREVNIYVTAAGEGTTRPAEYHYSLDAAGETLTDEAGGGMVRRRCGPETAE